LNKKLVDTELVQTLKAPLTTKESRDNALAYGLAITYLNYICHELDVDFEILYDAGYRRVFEPDGTQIDTFVAPGYEVQVGGFTVAAEDGDGIHRDKNLAAAIYTAIQLAKHIQETK